MGTQAYMGKLEVYSII